MLVDELVRYLGCDDEWYSRFGNEIYKNSYLDSMSIFLWERGYLTVKQARFAEELLSQIRSHWYYFED